jgi:phosphoribosylformylglycinamidine synthase
MIKARVTVTLKNGVLDPQGKAIEHALSSLGFDGVGHVRQGKVFDIAHASASRLNTSASSFSICAISSSRRRVRLRGRSHDAIPATSRRA